MFESHLINKQSPWIPNDLTAEAASIIAKHKHPQYQSYFWDRMGKALVDYTNRPELITEVLNQIEDKHGSYASLLILVFHFADALSDLQIRKMSDLYTGNQLLYRMASLLLNVNINFAATIDTASKGAKFQLLYLKIKNNWSMVNSQSQKQYIGDIVPNNTGVSDRFGTGHDGSHIRSPKTGGKVVTIETLKGIVIRQYVQETAKNGNLYGVWVLLKSGIVVVYKDILSVDAKIKRLQLGRLYMNGINPTSRTVVSAGDFIGTIRPWETGDSTNSNDVGLHITFLHIKYINEFKEHLKPRAKEKADGGAFSIEKLIAPCRYESPVRCL